MGSGLQAATAATSVAEAAACEKQDYDDDEEDREHVITSRRQAQWLVRPSLLLGAEGVDDLVRNVFCGRLRLVNAAFVL